KEAGKGELRANLLPPPLACKSRDTTACPAWAWDHKIDLRASGQGVPPPGTDPAGASTPAILAFMGKAAQQHQKNSWRDFLPSGGLSCGGNGPHPAEPDGPTRERGVRWANGHEKKKVAAQRVPTQMIPDHGFTRRSS